MNKRKRGLIRKAIELHDLCGQEIMIQIFDKASNTLVTFQSDEETGPKAFHKMSMDEQIIKERYWNEHYSALKPKYITKRVKESFLQMTPEAALVPENPPPSPKASPKVQGKIFELVKIDSL